MWIDYGLVNEFLREWCLRKEQLKNGEISEDEYFEWKINWSATRSYVNEKEHDEKLAAINGNLIPETIYIRFKHPTINDRLAKFAKTKKWQKNLFASKDAFPSEEAFQQEVAQMNETCGQIKQHLVDTNIVVKKGVSGIAIKVYLEN